MFRRRHPGEKGFSLVELLIVVAILGIIASITMPFLIDALHRAKQRRTMGELAMVGQAWMSWLTDQTGAASAGQGKLYSVQGFDVVDYPDLFSYLHPNSTFFYMQEVPQLDAWGSSLRFWQNPNLQADRVIVICASARDNIFETCDNTTWSIGPFVSTDFDTDIVWADGGFVRWPGALGVN